MTGGKECTCNALSLAHEEPHVFATPQWHWPQVIYILYRLIVFGYFFSWLVISVIRKNSTDYFIYLTNYAFILLNLSILLQLISSIWKYKKMRQTPEGREDDLNGELAMPWFLKFSWYVHTVSSDMALVVSLIYWTVLYPQADAEPEVLNLELGMTNETNDGTNDFDLNFNTHAMNSIYVVVDIFIVAIPVRILHVLYTLPIAGVYITLSVAYTLQTEKAIYPILDWINTPGEASLYAFAVGFALVPLFHLVLYGLYRARSVLHSKIFAKKLRVQNTQTDSNIKSKGGLYKEIPMQCSALRTTVSDDNIV